MPYLIVHVYAAENRSLSGNVFKEYIYQLLHNPRINWLRLMTLLSRRLADTVEPLTDSDRINAVVVDDSMLERTSCKKTELGSKVFDHISMKYRKAIAL